MVRDGFLEPYRVLDLTDEKGFLCGRFLGDLGADVIKIEPPGGDPTRLRSPFWADTPDPESSLYWYAFNASKRGITLDLEQNEGREIFKRLVLTADLVLESFPPGYLDTLGLGYEDLSKINPQVILTSITPFGQTGPYRDYQASDLSLMALGGICKMTGDRDRAPLRLCHDQSYALGSLNAVAASLIALWHRHQSDQGQHADVSILESLVRSNFREPVLWEFEKKMALRSSDKYTRTTGDFQFIWPCKDGYLAWLMFGGKIGARENKELTAWMEKSGTFNDLLLRLESEGTVNLAAFDGGLVQDCETLMRSFFLTKTRRELRAEGARRGLSLAPISGVDDVVDDDHLEERGFWVQVAHPERDRAVSYPGRFFLSDRCGCEVRRRAPLVGEHNQEILEEIRGLPVHRPDRGIAGPGMKQASSKGALEGVKILDFTWWAAGPLATKMLADHGAEVIKVESNARLDLYRQSEPFAGRRDVNTGLLFVHVNSSKRSITLNLTLPQGIEVAKRLVRWADVVVDNFSPGTMKRLGLGYDELTRIKPEIIVASLSCQGQTGPRAAPGNAHVSGALSGHYYMTGWPDRSPTHVVSAGHADVVQPLTVAVAIMAALHYKKQTGKGQYLDISQLEPMIQLVGPAVLDFAVNGRVAGRNGNRHPDAAPHGLFRCKGEDQWCAVAVFSEGEWQSLCQEMGRPELIEDARFKSLSQRKQNEDDLEQIIENWTKDQSAREVMERLQRVGVTAGVAQDGRDLVDYDPQLRERGCFVKLEHPEIGVCNHPAPPFKLSATPAKIRTSPCLGQDNLYVFNEILGLSEDQIADLMADEVIS